MIRRMTLAVLVILVCGIGVQAENGPEERIKRVENGLVPPVLIRGDEAWNIHDRMKHYGVPGLSVAVIHNFEIVWTKAYGVKDTETGEPVNDTTMFQAASISKPLNATAVMKLVQDGRISLDEDVNTYLVSWKLPDNEYTAGRKVTVANLLSHTGGTTMSGFPGYAAGAPLPTVQQILGGEEPANTDPVVVNTAPGRAYRYSGGGTTILQLMVTEMAGKPYKEHMRELILDPLGMENSTFEQPLPAELRPKAASAHRNFRGPVEGRYHVYPELAAAGLWTTAGDLARFAIEHQLSLKSGSNLILSAEMEEKMMTPYLSDYYGLGWGVRDLDGEIYFMHTGGNYGFNCTLIAHKRGGYGAVVMANSNAMDLIGEVVRAIAVEYEWEGYINGPHDLFAVPEKTLRRYAGRYELGEDEMALITVVEEHLSVDVTGEKPFELYPISMEEFIRRDHRSRIQFIPGAEPSGDIVRVYGDGPVAMIPRMSSDKRIPFEMVASGDIDEGLDRYREIKAGDGSHRAVTERRLNLLGYELLGKDLVKEAIALFALNVEFYPDSWNVYDSLGEAYLKDGERELAIENYRRSLELNPGNSNGRKVLEEIGE